MGSFLESRRDLSLVTSLLAGIVLLRLEPFPAGDWLCQILQHDKPAVFYTVAGLYHLFLFTTPFWAVSGLLSCIYTLRRARTKPIGPIFLPPLPEMDGHLRLIIGEQHRARTPEPVENPDWLVMEERGLYTGIAVIGAIGSGKTSCCMYPFAEQIFSFGGSERGKHIGGLVLEVKGDFCHKVRGILARHGRAEDYIEINLDGSAYRYNPLWNDLDPYALAFGIATLLTSLFGRGREPFWQQAYTNMVKFLIHLHRLLFDYVTLLDLYECAINPDLLKQRVELVEWAATTAPQIAVLDPAVYLAFDGLSRFPWDTNAATHEMESGLTDELAKFLLENSVLHQVRDGEALPSGGKLIRDPEQRERVQYRLWQRRVSVPSAPHCQERRGGHSCKPSAQKSFWHCPTTSAHGKQANFVDVMNSLRSRTISRRAGPTHA